MTVSAGAAAGARAKAAAGGKPHRQKLEGWREKRLEPLDAAARHDLLEILEDRYGRRSTMVTSQLPVDRWHEIIGDPTYADAILDVSFTTPTGSNSPVIAYAERAQSKSRKLDHTMSSMSQHPHAGRRASPGRLEIGTEGDIISESRAR